MISTSDIPFILLAIAIVVLLGFVLYLNRKMQMLLAGGIGKDLPEAIAGLRKITDNHEEFKRSVSEYLKEAEARILRSTQAVSVVRFNPFKGVGEGGQSFAITFLNEDGDGLILSSLYARDRVSVYAKPLTKLVSPFELTTEEKESLTKATLSLKKK